MKTEIILNNVKVIKDIPTTWAAVNYGDFLKLQTVLDFPGRVSIFTGIDSETLIKAEISNLDSVIQALGFLNTQPENMKVPDKILNYPIPKDLGFETIAQFEDLKNALKDAKEMSILQHLEKYPLYCAIFACKPYDWMKAEDMQTEFLKAPCLEVLAVGNFTLAKLTVLNLTTAASYQKINTPWKKFKLALTVFRLRLAFMVRSFIWRKKRGINAVNS